MRGSRRLPSLLLALPLVLAACGGGISSDREAFVETMLDVAELTVEEAECVADRIYDSGDFTEEELSTAANDYNDVPGFQAAIDDAVDDCL